jgi:hypothetical protein
MNEFFIIKINSHAIELSLIQEFLIGVISKFDKTKFNIFLSEYFKASINTKNFNAFLLISIMTSFATL